MNGMQIVEVDWSDSAHRQAVVAILNDYAQGPVEGGQPLPQEVQVRLPDALAACPTSYVLLAFFDGEPVGVAVCFGGFSTFAGRPLINVHDLAVLSEHRGQGIGTALLEAVTERARQTGCCKVTLEVRVQNSSARRFYERVGFTDAGGQPTQFLERRV